MYEQESHAIAEVTARCAIYMSWTISKVPGYAHGYYSRNC